MRLYLLKFFSFQDKVENQLDKKIKGLRTNREGKYESNPCNVFCEEHGIIDEITLPYSPKANGVVEGKNRMFKDMIITMLVSFEAPNLWGEAILVACHVQNKIPYKKLKRHHMSFEKVIHLTLAILKCGDVLLRCSFLILKRVNWVLRLWIVCLLSMLRTTLLIGSWC